MDPLGWNVIRVWFTLVNLRRLRTIGKVFVPSVGPGSLGDGDEDVAVLHHMHYGHNFGG